MYWANYRICNIHNYVVTSLPEKSDLTHFVIPFILKLSLIMQKILQNSRKLWNKLEYWQNCIKPCLPERYSILARQLEYKRSSKCPIGVLFL